MNEQPAEGSATLAGRADGGEGDGAKGEIKIRRRADDRRVVALFFIVAGCLLLWLNVQPRQSNVILTNSEDYHPPSPSQDTKDDIRKVDVLEQQLTDAETKPDAASATLSSSRPDAPKDMA